MSLATNAPVASQPAPLYASAEAEMSAVGGLFQCPEAIDDVAAIVGESDWFYSDVGVVFAAQQRVYAQTGRCALSAVLADLRATGFITGEPGVDEKQGWVARLMDSGVAHEPTIVRNARVVADFALYRRVRGLARRVDQEPHPGERTAQWAAEIADQFTKASEGVAFEEPEHVGQMMDALVDEINAVAEGKAPEKTVPYGVSVMDRATDGGMRAGQLIVIAGRPSDGKSAVALSIALDAAKAGHKVLLFSTEMDNRQQAQRMLAQMARVSFAQQREAKLDGSAWTRVSEAANAAKALPFWSYDIASLHVSKMKALCKSHARRHGVGLVVIDYVQRLLAGGDDEQDWLRVSKATEACKTLARELEIPVVVLAQLKRESADRKGKPTLSHLRQSGKIEEEADVVWMLHRDENAEGEEAQYRELGVVKNRNGQAFQWYHMRLHPETFRLNQLSDDHFSRVQQTQAMRPKKSRALGME